jgi:hypothetical protein
VTEVFPIGHYVGERHAEGLHYVRVGLEHQTMTEEELDAWALSHQDSPEWTVDELLPLAEKADPPSAPSLWRTCEIRSKLSNVPAPDLVPEILADPRPLLANSCGYLDRAR